MKLTPEIIGTWIAVVGFVFQYFKDKGAAQKELGKLEQKVENIQREVDKVDGLTQQINQANLHLVRLESKIDTLVDICDTSERRRRRPISNDLD
jgi:hypothetical protein